MSETNGNGKLPAEARGDLLLNREEFEARLQQQVLNATSLRTEFLRRYLSIDGFQRNINSSCNYPEGVVIDPWYFRDLYDREPVATRVVELMPKECWQVQPEVYEDEDADSDTPFEKGVADLSKTLRGQSWYQDDEGGPVNECLFRADKLSRIGTYGIILIGFDDGRPLYEPVEGLVSNKRPTDNRLLQQVSVPRLDLAEIKYAEGFIKTSPHAKVTTNMSDPSGKLVGQLTRNVPNPSTSATVYQGGEFAPLSASSLDSQYLGVQYSPPEFPVTKPRGPGLGVIFIRPFDQTLVQVTQWESNIRSPRFGQPIMYRVTLNDPREQHTGIGMPMATVQVHWTRVVHLADNLNSSEVIGVPAIRPVLNPVLDIRKIRGAAGEAYWKGGFPGISLETHPQLGGDVPVDSSSIKDMFENYFNDLQRYMLNVGMSAKMLSPTCVDPTPYVNVAMEAICVQLGCPVRVFRGSERGELASSQDDSAWNDRVRHRQVSYVTPRVIVSFYDRMIMSGVLPQPRQKTPEEVVANARRRGAKVNYDRQTGHCVIYNAQGAPTQVSTRGGYSVRWPDLDSLGDRDKAQIALQETQAIAAYVSGGCENFVDPKNFWTEVMGRDDEQAEALVQGALDHQEEQLDAHGDMVEAGEEHDLQPTPPPGFEKKPEPPPPLPGMPGGPPQAPVKLGAGQQLVHPESGKTVAKVPFPPKAEGVSRRGQPTKNEVDENTWLVENAKYTFGKPVDNSFCPTGEGGGVDPFCTPGGSGGGEKKTLDDHVADLKSFRSAMQHPDLKMEDADAVVSHVMSGLSPKDAKHVAGEVAGHYGITSKKSATEKLLRELRGAKEFADRADTSQLTGGQRFHSQSVLDALPGARALLARAKE